MDRCAVFVDAGYLFAQGGTLLAGSRRQRTELTLDAPAAIAALKSVVAAKSASRELLRIYWYDGAIGGSR